MDPIEQVLLSAKVEDANWSCELLGATNAVHPVDLRELEGWFSGEIVNSSYQPGTSSLFFHPLPGGTYTIGRLIPRRTSLGLPHHRRSFYIQHLIVSASTLRSFANNPIALYQELYALGKVPVFPRTPFPLDPIFLPGPWTSASSVDDRLLSELSRNPGIPGLAILMQSALDSVCTFFSGGPSPIRLISGLFNLLPLSWRPELTFSTDLHFSKSRPFKLIGVQGSPNLIRMNAVDMGISYCDFSAIRNSETKTLPLLDYWAQFIFHILEQKSFDFLREKYEEESGRTTLEQSPEYPPGTDPEELKKLAELWFAEIFCKGSFQEALRRLREKPGSQDPAVFEIPHLKKKGKGIRKNGDKMPEKSGEEKKGEEKPALESEKPVFSPLIDLPAASGQEFHSALSASESHFPVDAGEFHALFGESEERFSKSPNPKFSLPQGPIPLAMQIQQKVIPFDHSAPYPLVRRIRKSPYLRDELKWLDSCIARVLLGDQSALVPFQLCWKGICSTIQPAQRLELVEEYCELVRDFMNQRPSQDQIRMVERDINILEIIDALVFM